MKRLLAILGVATLPVMIAVTVVSYAQTPQPSVVARTAPPAQGPQGAPPPPPPSDFFFVASEVGFGGKLVKGAPYSAEAVTETIQTLSDGNRIVNRTSSLLYRDSEGRTRREQTLKILGPLGDGGEPIKTVFINDPVAGVSYALDARTHIAHKSTPFKFEQRVMPPAGGEVRTFEYRIESPRATVTAQAAPPAGAPAAAPETGQFTFTTESGAGGGATYIFTRKKEGPDPNEVREQLGKQIIEGVEAEGTRTTVTIPVGEIGNERPIEIVNERWYSPELQVVVMSRHSDPRTGETTYKLTNINRTEPAKSLFEVPGDYTIKEGVPAPPAPAGFRMRRPGGPE